MSNTIPDGYYLKARCIKDSAIAHAPPHVREIWDYLLREAFWKDGRHVKRGEVPTGYDEIREALHWKIGWRKEGYSKSQCETAMKHLKKHGMITTRRTTGGFIVSICNYERFQTPDNYENHKETATRTTGEPQPPDTTDEEGYKKEELKGSAPAPVGFPHDLFERFKAVHPSCGRVKDFEFQRALSAYPGCDVAEAVEAFERQFAGAGSIRVPLGAFEGYLRQSVGKKGAGRRFLQKNAAQTLAEEEAVRSAIKARLLERPAGEESQAERMKRMAEERAKTQRAAMEIKSED